VLAPCVRQVSTFLSCAIREQGIDMGVIPLPLSVSKKGTWPILFHLSKLACFLFRDGG
jgi:hypothetical protein